MAEHEQRILEQGGGEEEEGSRNIVKDNEILTVLHKTKSIHFFGRSTPIILQNDNGPCPLLAICNVLLLKNQLNLSSDISEVSQEKLLSLVAERLIDSNSNVANKDAGFVENQQQNISDAINLLPQLATGIDVNIKFRRIDDFEFTPECAIFDLLDIPLYHGWLVDPQDHETAEAIGSKSYNTITSDLVALETRKMGDDGKVKLDEDCVDFVAATTATLGVPSPNLSMANKSFEDSPHSTSEHQSLRKGDAEEQAELMKVLELSENESTAKVDACEANATSQEDVVTTSEENAHMIKATPESVLSITEANNCAGSLDLRDSGESHKSIADEPREVSFSNNVVTSCADSALDWEHKPSSSLVNDIVHNQQIESSVGVVDQDDELLKQNGEENSFSIAGQVESESSSGRVPSIEAIESFTSSLGESEPIYEGEDCILDNKNTVCDDHEPVYEGEMVLADQADKGTKDVCDTSQNDEITIRQGELISNFLKNNASQLTFYGLFCLQEGLNERELCVFFRNNHFSTMFKFEGELYLLATDQGYLNQPDLVWEKLNEVNGDTLFMTSNFKEFKLESSGNSTWDEQNAVASTADYLASIDNTGRDVSNINSDLQLAIALQQQEFEQQPQRNASVQQPPANGSSRLVTGPQAPRSSGRATSSSQRQEQKPKDKDKSNCKIM